MDANSSREVVELLARLARAVERVEVTLCGPRPAKPAPTAEEREAWREVNRDLGRIRHAPADDGGDLPPSGGIPPAEFFKRREPR